MNTKQKVDSPQKIYRYQADIFPFLQVAGFADSNHKWCGYQTTWDLCMILKGHSRWRYRGRTVDSMEGSLIPVLTWIERIDGTKVCFGWGWTGSNTS